MPEQALERSFSPEFPQQKMRYEEEVRADHPKSLIVRQVWYEASVIDMGDGIVDEDNLKVPTVIVGLDADPEFLKNNQFKRFRYERKLEKITGKGENWVSFHITGTTKKEDGVTINMDNLGGIWHGVIFMSDADLPNPKVPYLKECYQITWQDGALQVEQPFDFHGSWEKKEAAVLKRLTSALQTADILLKHGEEHAQPVAE